MAVYYVDQRFISYLFELSERASLSPSPGTVSLTEGRKTLKVVLPDTVKTIAEQFGTVREVLSREISKMVKKGWIRKKGQVVEILDRKAMEGRIREG